MIIIATGVMLHITTNNYILLNNDLMKFFNFVENNNHSYMFICDSNLNISYINKKIKEFYNNEISNEKFKNDLLENKDIFNKLNYIISNLDKYGYWRGIVKDSKTGEVLDCYIQSLNLSEEKNLEILVSYVDIAEHLKLEEEIEMIKLKNTKKDEFISNISHELKTPLNIFYSTTQLLEKLNEDKNINFRDKFNEYSGSLKLNCKRMLRLINNIIDVSRIDLGILKPEYGNYNIISLIEDISLSVIPYALSKNIFIEFDTNMEEHYIKCDPTMIEKILLNFMSNSIKYSNMNSNIYVYVSVEYSTTKIYIKDEGIGIDENIKQHIFDRFVRGDNSFTRLNEGCGIGLSIAKSMIDMHNGTISLKSEVNKGTIFEISLPNIVIQGKEMNNYRPSTSYNVELELSDIYELYK